MDRRRPQASVPVGTRSVCPGSGGPVRRGAALGRPLNPRSVSSGGYGLPYSTGKLPYGKALLDWRASGSFQPQDSGKGAMAPVQG